MATTTDQQPKYLLVDADTGELIKELANTPSVLMLKELYRLASTVMDEQHYYYTVSKSPKQLSICKEAEKKLREYLKKLPQHLSTYQ